MYSQKQTIKCWAEDDRPREKMMLKGRGALSDAELLAILLGSGTRDKSAVELAQELLQLSNGNWDEFARKSIGDLKKVKGIGEAKAVTIAAALEVARRKSSQPKSEKVKITSSAIAYQEFKMYFEDLQTESFYMMLLNRANQVLRIELISTGGMSSTVVDGKVIFKKALELSAHAMILAHNHPSGSMMPSEADKSLTKKLVNFGKMIDLTVLDHLIYTDSGYYSFADEGEL